MEEFSRICSLLESEDEEEEEELEWVQSEEESAPRPIAITPPEVTQITNDEASTRDLLIAMNQSIVQMAAKMEENKVSIQESLAKTLKTEIRSQVKKEAKNLKKKIAKYMGDEIIDIKTQTHQATEELATKIQEDRAANIVLTTKVQKLEDAMMFFNQRYEEHEAWRR